jgi:hypothetical protein
MPWSLSVARLFALAALVAEGEAFAAGGEVSDAGVVCSSLCFTGSGLMEVFSEQFWLMQSEHLPSLAHLHDLQFPVLHAQHLAGGGVGMGMVVSILGT